jgi:hypothetical protein
MRLRGWGNGLTAAGLILAVGIAVAQAPEGNTRYLLALGITVISAIVAIGLLRPRAGEESAKRINYLRTQTTDRDIAVLRIGAQAISFPETLSRNALALAPVGEEWGEESKEKANARAQKLIALGLMEQRGSEVETSTLGRAVLAFDDALRMQRQGPPDEA